MGDEPTVKKIETVAIVTNDRKRFSELAQSLQDARSWIVRWIASVSEARQAAAGSALDVMVLDEEVDGIANIGLARDIVMANPMLTLALVSPLPADAFHEATEGLGVAAQLPRRPGKEDALGLAETIEKICFSSP